MGKHQTLPQFANAGASKQVSMTPHDIPRIHKDSYERMSQEDSKRLENGI